MAGSSRVVVDLTGGSDDEDGATSAFNAGLSEDDALAQALALSAGSKDKAHTRQQQEDDELERALKASMADSSTRARKQPAHASSSSTLTAAARHAAQQAELAAQQAAVKNGTAPDPNGGFSAADDDTVTGLSRLLNEKLSPKEQKLSLIHI